MNEKKVLEGQRNVLCELRDGYAEKFEKAWLSKTIAHYDRIVEALVRAIFEMDGVLEEMEEENKSRINPAEQPAEAGGTVEGEEQAELDTSEDDGLTGEKIKEEKEEVV